MKSTIRTALLAFAFAATSAAALTGASLRGESMESGLGVDCAAAVWPMIPAACLNGGSGHEVRYVSTDMNRMQQRFATAFE